LVETLSLGARRLTASACDAWDLVPIAADAQLLVSELVTNAVLHAGTAITVYLDVASGFLHIAVEDQYPLHPQALPSRTDLLNDIDSIAELSDSPGAPDQDLRHPSLHAGPSRSIAAGRGLLIVSALADYWGTVATGPQSKAVWARQPIHRQWPHLEDCSCAQASSRTPSGAPVQHDGPPLELSMGS
jgi:hypothetical protein